MKKFALPFLILAFYSIAAAQTPPIKVGRYTLQSNPWVNLHQRLMYEARFKSKPPQALAGESLTKWNAGVEAYKKFLGNRNPIEDAELIRLDLQLSKHQAATPPSSIPAAAAQTLAEMMTVYKTALWKEDDSINQFCISFVQPLIASAAEELIAEHEKVYGMPFPRQILVDMSALGWQFGAYTVGPPDSAHVIFQCADNPANQGYMALESLLHEPSHVIVGDISGAIGADITKISKELRIKPRYNLWHAILFYTSGELTRRALVKRGVMNYIRMIDAGMYERGFQGFKQPLETHWQAYLDGKITRETAVREILLATTAK